VFHPRIPLYGELYHIWRNMMEYPYIEKWRNGISIYGEI
jgi:hypothetical protein